VYYNSKIIGLVVQEETDVTGWSEIYRFEYAGKTGMVVYADPMYWTPAVGLSFMKYDHNLGFGQTQSYLDLDQISSFRLLVNYYYVFCGESVLFDNVTPESYLKDETGILAGAGYESLDEYFTGITKEYLYKDEISGKDLRWETPFSVLDWIANGVVQNKTIYDVVFAVGYWNGSEFVRSIGYYQDRKAVPFLSEEDEIYDEIMELYSGKNTPPTEYVGALPYTDGYPLRAGELSEEYMQWCADMINIYRIGTGLRGIVIGENSNEYMQDATAYSAYIYKDIGRRSLYMDGTHYIKDDGVVSKEILDKAVAASFSGAIMPGGSNVASGIRALVHDNFPGAKYLRGHRHTLLSQVIEALGIGSVPIYGTGRYSIITGWGSTVYNDLPKVVGFPAVGVSLHELTGNMVDRWSVQLENNKYYFGTNASVTIKRLNDGREWKYGKIDGMERFFSSVTIASWNGYDILLRAGDVYEVTLSGIMELYTWQSAEDFVYRTVIR
jgi:hypothetical protein